MEPKAAGSLDDQATQIARLGGETLDGGTDPTIPGKALAHDPKAVARLREWADRHCPQLALKISEYLDEDTPELIRYGMQDALDKGKTGHVSWVRGLLRNKKAQRFVPLPLLDPVEPSAEGTAPPAPAPPRFGPGRNTARMQETREKLRKYRQQQEASSDERQ